MKRTLLTATFALLGDFALLRFCIALLASALIAAAMYWLSLPNVLPLWPGVLLLTIGAVAGLVWELTAERQNRPYQ
jgi:hypothetical protein